MRFRRTSLDTPFQATILQGVLLVLLVFSTPGCVRKRLTFRTNPGGAMVYVDKQPIGLTPVSTSFTYYGTRSIEIVKDGYRTEKFLRKIHPPWYGVPPLDFVSETLWPFEQRDERIIDVQMSPDPIVPNEALIASGEQLRLQAGQGIAVTPPPTAGFVPTPPMTNPGLMPYPPAVIVAPNSVQPSPKWSPGTWMKDLLFPNGPTLSVPSTQIVPGGGYRPPNE